LSKRNLLYVRVTDWWLWSGQVESLLCFEDI